MKVINEVIDMVINHIEEVKNTQGYIDPRYAIWAEPSDIEIWGLETPGITPSKTDVLYHIRDKADKAGAII